MNLLLRIRILTWFVILGLVISGATAIPLTREVDSLVSISGARTSAPWLGWLLKVQRGLHEVADDCPFLFYGTDWLAFGHFVIALVFIGALRDPVRNQWLFTFGVLASALVVPYALVFGAIRGIPWWWRCIDCSFGLVAFVPLFLCRKWCRKVEYQA